MKRVPIDEYCEKKISTLSPQYKGSIDYIDISSVDNLEKKIINIQQLTTEEAPSRAKQLLQVGDILVSTVRPNLNAVAMVEQNSKNILVGSTGYCVLRCKNNINNRYVFHFCQSLYFVDDMVKQATGASYPAVNSNIVKNSLIPEYTEEKQNEIVITLDKTDNLIYERKKQLLKLDELVKARFVEMFGLPVSNTMNWETEKMQSIAPSQNYLGEMPDEVWLLNLDMIESQTGKIIDYLIVPKDEVGNSTCVFDVSTVLYSKLRPYLNKVVIPNRCGYATSELVPLKPNSSKLNREYLAYMLRSDEFVTMISEKVAGAKMPRVSMNDFRNFEVPIPPIELQNEFANFVKQTDKSKFEVQQSLEKLETLKKSLMQQYFG